MILIQRTTERNCHLALDNLEGYFTAEQLLEMDLEKLRELIRPAGFNKQKSVYIKELMDWYKGHRYSLDKFKDIPTEDIRTELLSIKGVGLRQRMRCCCIYLSGMYLLQTHMRFVCLTD